MMAFLLWCQAASKEFRISSAISQENVYALFVYREMILKNVPHTKGFNKHLTFF